MTRYYRVFNHGPHRHNRAYSINDVLADGTYISQAAFWYDTLADARADAQRLLEEDRANGHEAELLEGCGTRAELEVAR